MTDREIVLCVTGGIAAYKAADLCSRLRQRGANVTVAMTDAARQLVAPITFEAVSGNAVAVTLWPPPGTRPLDHIALADRAELVCVAPATANFLAKAAAGIADDVVTTTFVTVLTTVPVVIAPAMNERMWANPIVERNVATLRDAGCRFVGPATGWLACGTSGPGRMAEPADIVDTIAAVFEEPGTLV
jgi:phosphopantothenoylcysteine decarboxylase/phosphopantothenate--cysteine ligase